jgi:hypothetical protein
MLESPKLQVSYNKHVGKNYTICDLLGSSAMPAWTITLVPSKLRILCQSKVKTTWLNKYYELVTHFYAIFSSI